jgi:Bacterial Ig domain
MKRGDLLMRNKATTLWILTLFATAVVASLAALELPRAEAADPPLDTGTIYFFGDGGISEMDPDGTGRTATSAGVEYYSEPSTLPHGSRWFLQVDEVSGQSYPDGRARLELFAINEAGTTRVQLTDGKIDASTFIEPNNNANPLEGGMRCHARWTDGDCKVSYLAMRTSYDGDGNRSVQDGGPYALAVNPDSLSNHTTVAMNGAPLVALPLTPPDTFLLAPSYAWKPDGSALVFRVPPDQTMTTGMWRADASSSFANPTLLTQTDGGDYRWSPDGSKILFNAGLETGIKVIDASGSNETLVVADPADLKKEQRFLREIDWSPNGTHIVYGYFARNLRTYAGRWDIYRATATGSGITNLTGSHETGGSYPKWRRTGSPPDVTITQPTDGSDIWGTVTIRATATDDGTVSKVEFFVGATSIGTDTSSPFEVSWSSSGVLDGEHTISATATDNNDETGTDSVTVTVDNVDNSPEVTITEPEGGDTVSGSSVTIAATAVDDGSVAKVEFFVDGTLVGTDTVSPYAISWDSTGVSDAGHSILAKATDDAGKTGTDSITVTVNNAPPSLSVTSISPNQVRDGKSVNVTVTGTGFAADGSLTLANGSGPAVTVSNVVVVNSTTITATIAAAKNVSKGTWAWDVVVTNPGGASATLTDGFTVFK